MQSVSVPPRKWFLGNNRWSHHHHQIRHGDCLRREDAASRVNSLYWLWPVIQGHAADLNQENAEIVFDYFRNRSSKAHQVYFEDIVKVWSKCSSCSLILISQTVLKLGIPTWHDGRFMHGISLYAHRSCSFRWPWPCYKVTVAWQRKRNSALTCLDI